MIIPSNYFIFIDIAIIIVYLIAITIAVKNGFLLQILSLVFSFLAIFISWLVAPILANSFPLIKLENTVYTFDISPIINSFIYTIIVFVILRIIYFFIAPLFKSISKVPIVGPINRLGGFLLGVVNGTIAVLLISMVLKTPFIINSEEIKNNTLLKYCESLTNEVVKVTVKNINFDALKNKIEDFDVDEAREILSVYLKEKGIINE